MEWTTVDAVLALCENAQPTPTARVVASIRASTAFVRARLARLYGNSQINEWGNTPPEPIPTIVQFLSAALLQANTFSITNIGAVQNPYAQQLYQTAMEMLTEVMRGFAPVEGESLQHTLPVFSPAQEIPDLFRTIRQYRRSGVR